MEYITEILGVKISRKNWEDSNKLPYFLIDEYNFESVQLDNCNCVFIKPKKDVAVINTVKKHFKADMKNGILSGERCFRNYKRNYYNR